MFFTSLRFEIIEGKKPGHLSGKKLKAKIFITCLSSVLILVSFVSFLKVSLLLEFLYISNEDKSFKDVLFKEIVFLTLDKRFFVFSEPARENSAV